jgi:gluconokinase
MDRTQTRCRLIVVMGIMASGKTTVARALAAELGYAFLEADDFHGAENIAKMARGEPLDDADRAGWLQILRKRVDQSLERGESVVLACSALKESYRRVLGVRREGAALVYLRASAELVVSRARLRAGHFMPESLVRSQLETLEEPRDAIVIDAELEPNAIVAAIVRALAAAC